MGDFRSHGVYPYSLNSASNSDIRSHTDRSSENLRLSPNFSQHLARDQT